VVQPAPTTLPTFQPAPTPPPTSPAAGAASTGQGRGPLLVVLAVVVAIVAGIGAVFVFVLGGDGDDEEAAPTTVPVATLPGTSGTTDSPTTTVDAPADSDVRATVAQLAESTVQVVLLSGDRPTCSGSGTIISDDGTILTNAHVIQPDPGCPYDRIGIAVTTDAGRPPDLRYVADVYAYDPVVDLAVVRIATDLDGVVAPGPFKAVPVGDSDEVEIGDQLRILGYPGIGGETVTFTNGVVSGFAAQNGIADRSWIKTDATIAGGNSGGAAFDDEGRLIGVPTQAAASDTGDVVDCRVIADTNGDGVTNSEDACVPIGGFLNGLRPVNLALPLIAEAETGSPIDIGRVEPEGDFDGVFDPGVAFAFNPAWSNEASDDPNVSVDFIQTADSDMDQLCFWFDWAGFPQGASWDGIWRVDGVVNENFSFITQTWTAGTEGTDYWLCASDAAGLAPGLYEVLFYIEEQVIFYESLRVTENPVPVHDVTFLNRTDGLLCFLYTGPAGSLDTGLDELGTDEVLQPGERSTIPIPQGRTIADAYDCDGNVLYENYEGFEVNGPLTIEVGG
jgi:S1-C subfamily serine protease